MTHKSHITPGDPFDSIAPYLCCKNPKKGATPVPGPTINNGRSKSSSGCKNHGFGLVNTDNSSLSGGQSGERETDSDMDRDSRLNTGGSWFERNNIFFLLKNRPLHTPQGVSHQVIYIRKRRYAAWPWLKNQSRSSFNFQ